MENTGGFVHRTILHCEGSSRGKMILCLCFQRLSTPTPGKNAQKKLFSFNAQGAIRSFPDITVHGSFASGSRGAHSVTLTQSVGIWYRPLLSECDSCHCCGQNSRDCFQRIPSPACWLLTFCYVERSWRKVIVPCLRSPWLPPAPPCHCR